MRKPRLRKRYAITLFLVELYSVKHRILNTQMYFEKYIYLSLFLKQWMQCSFCCHVLKYYTCNQQSYRNWHCQILKHGKSVIHNYFVFQSLLQSAKQVQKGIMLKALWDRESGQNIPQLLEERGHQPKGTNTECAIVLSKAYRRSHKIIWFKGLASSFTDL